ncbi:hypothetical protein NP569_24545, partial [Vibrio parahaemolyticus]|nr:hypothetical protein [Vibrio parahaemolyticus]
EVIHWRLVAPNIDGFDGDGIGAGGQGNAFGPDGGAGGGLEGFAVVAAKDLPNPTSVAGGAADEEDGIAEAGVRGWIGDRHSGLHGFAGAEGR